jgi:hypothetical protein
MFWWCPGGEGQNPIGWPRGKAVCSFCSMEGRGVLQLKPWWQHQATHLGSLWMCMRAWQFNGCLGAHTLHPSGIQ